MVSTVMVGVLVALVPGLVTGWVLGGLAGWVMRRDDYCRHPAPPPVPAVVPVVGERLASRVVPAVVIVHVHQGAALPERWSPAGMDPGRVLELASRWSGEG